MLADTAGATTPTTGLDGADVVGVARGADGFTAVGSRDGKAVIWASADGVAWTAAQRRNDPHAAFTAVGAGAGRVLVLGSLLSEEGTPSARSPPSGPPGAPGRPCRSAGSATTSRSPPSRATPPAGPRPRSASRRPPSTTPPTRSPGPRGRGSPRPPSAS
ncbi:hypothetical protein ACFQV2_27415 [Actinokineospora soli]|uniref:Uncharacterized protein n=1 Tax=Actinokineospora soli TaxID=1048753 RepID=A0ABW2TS21_9PSEU